MNFFTSPAWIVFVFFFSWFTTISGVILGGSLVYKASGNTGPLFRVKSDSPQGAVNLDEGFEEGEQEDFQMPNASADAMSRFMKDFDPGEMIFGKNEQKQTEGAKDAESNES